MEFSQRRSWIEVDLTALAHNYRQLRGMLPPACRLMGVVKADAYGHGAIPIAQTLERLGAQALAVATLEEAVALRQGGITLPILCLGYTPPEYAPELLRYQITQMVENVAEGQALSAAAQREAGAVRVHLKVDTGMGRLGLLWRGAGDNTPLFQGLSALCALPGLEVEGVFTHFSDADGDRDYTLAQLAAFEQVRAGLEQRGIHIACYHCAASGAVLQYPRTHMDMVRVGLALYGYSPLPDNAGDFGLRPILTLKSKIAALHDLPRGSAISYGRTRILAQDSRLAVIPIGYADGYSRQFSNQMSMSVGGTLCPVVGRVCMDMCMIDVSHLPSTAVGDEVVVYAQGLTQQAARLRGSIVYEILCNLAPRLSRHYFDESGEVGRN